jgi:hypothetical protein
VQSEEEQRHGFMVRQVHSCHICDRNRLGAIQLRRNAGDEP